MEGGGGHARLMTLDPTASASARASVRSVGARISALGAVSPSRAATTSAIPLPAGAGSGITEGTRPPKNIHDDTAAPATEQHGQEQHEQLSLGTALGSAVARGDLARVSSICLQDPSLLAADLSRSGPSYNGRVGTPGAPVRCLSHHTTALLIAAQTGQAQMCELLLSLGADVDAKHDAVRVLATVCT